MKLLGPARWGWEVQKNGDADCSKMGMLAAATWGCYVQQAARYLMLVH